ncbi:MAG: hypothetical protein ACRD0V_07220 [Acidimicrobiales bacterium]
MSGFEWPTGGLGATTDTDTGARERHAAAVALAAAAARAGATGPDDDAGLLTALRILGLAADDE